MPLKSKKFFVHTVSKNRLKDVLSETLHKPSFVKFDELEDNATVNENTIIGKLWKKCELIHKKNPANAVRNLELLEVNEEMQIENSSLKLIVQLNDNLAFASHTLTDKHYVVISGFMTKSTRPKDGYHPIIISVQHSSNVLCFVCVEDVTAMSVLPQWQRLNVMKITDLKIHTSCCFYGIVTYSKIPKPNLNGEHKYYMLLTVIDESRKKLQCIIFSQHITDFPQINYFNIIRMEKAWVGRYKGQQQVTVHGADRLLVFNHHIHDSCLPKHTSSAPIITKEDLIRVNELKKWIQKFITKSCSLNNVFDDGISIFNLECQVLSINENKDNGSIILEVWDGTKPASFMERPKFDRNYKILMSCDMSVYEKCRSMIVEICVEDCTDECRKIKPYDFLLLSGLHLKTKVLCDDSVSNNGLKIFMVDSSSSKIFEFIDPSTEFISRLCVVSGISRSKIQPSTEDAMEIQSECIIGLTQFFSPTILSLSNVYEKQKCSTISEVKNHEAPYKFHLLANVIDCYPPIKPLDQFFTYICSKCGILLSGSEIKILIPAIKNGDAVLYDCPECSKTSNSTGESILQMKIGIKLLLEDDTGLLQVILWDDHVNKFFRGVSAEDLTENSSKFELISKFIARIKSVNVTKLDCCVFSYNTANGKKFQIFDTVIA